MALSEYSSPDNEIADDILIPFVPAMDLLEEIEAGPTAEEVGAIAIAIIDEAQQTLHQPSSNWAIQSRLEAVEQYNVDPKYSNHEVK